MELEFTVSDASAGSTRSEPSKAGLKMLCLEGMVKKYPKRKATAPPILPYYESSNPEQGTKTPQKH